MAARVAAALFRVSVSYIYKALIRRRRTGDISASPRRGHRPRKLSPAQEAALAAHIEAHPDLTLAALQAWLLAEHGVRFSNGAMWSAGDCQEFRAEVGHDESKGAHTCHDAKSLLFLTRLSTNC
jgi:transposase